MVTQFSASEYATQFYCAYYLQLMQEILAVMTGGAGGAGGGRVGECWWGGGGRAGGRGGGRVGGWECGGLPLCVLVRSLRAKRGVRVRAALPCIGLCARTRAPYRMCGWAQLPGWHGLPRANLPYLALGCSFTPSGLSSSLVIVPKRSHELTHVALPRPAPLSSPPAQTRSTSRGSSCRRGSCTTSSPSCRWDGREGERALGRRVGRSVGSSTVRSAALAVAHC